MKRQISIVALIATALIACQAVSAEAKVTKARSHKPTTSGVKLPSGNIDPGYGVKPGQLKTGSGFNINNVNGAPALPPKSTPITWGGNPPRAINPITWGGNPPRATNPITWGGNPPRAPTHGCGDKCGSDCYGHDCHRHDCHHGHDSMWWGQMCFGNMFGSYNGDCDDCYGDCDFDLCQ